MLVAATAGAAAQDYPTRSITVVVPFPAGGPSDVVARIVAEHMSKTLGQTLVIENVGAAGGTIGSARVRSGRAGRLHLAGRQHGIACVGARCSPRTSSTTRRAISRRSVHRPFAGGHRRRKDFPAKDLREFVAYLKENGNAVKQAHGGIGASSHMACLLFTSAIGASRRWSPIAAASGHERPDRRPRRFPLRAVRQRVEAGHAAARSRPTASPPPSALRLCPTCRPPRRPASTTR